MKKEIYANIKVYPHEMANEFWEMNAEEQAKTIWELSENLHHNSYGFGRQLAYIRDFIDSNFTMEQKICVTSFIEALKLYLVSDLADKEGE